MILGNELKYVEKVLNQESWSATGGSWNHYLERAFCKKLGVKHGIAMNSGTATLHSALRAAGIQEGDEVISPALTVIMDTTATLHAGATPVYADVDPHTFNIDPVDVERKISPQTKAIIAVALYGLMPDYDPLLTLAKKYGLVVIEDNAQAMMSTYKNRLAGTIGHMASFSFETTKHISCGEGGMVVTSNKTYAEKLRKIGGHGFKNLTADEGRVRLNQDVFQNPHYKRHDVLGWNYRLPEFNAAIALAQLEQINVIVAARVASANYFMDVMRLCDYLLPQTTPKNCFNSYYTLGVIYEGQEAKGVSWEAFRKAYIKNGGDGIYGAWSVPYQEPLMEGYEYVGYCPVAESIQPKLMQFKTNYMDMKLAERKAEVLWKTIKDLK